MKKVISILPFLFAVGCAGPSQGHLGPQPTTTSTTSTTRTTTTTQLMPTTSTTTVTSTTLSGGATSRTTTTTTTSTTTTRPTDAIMTTTGGYITVGGNVSYSRNSNLKLIGAIYAQSMTTLLYVTQFYNGYDYFYVYRPTDSGGLGNALCVIQTPEAYGSYGGLAFDGASYTLFSVSTGYPSYSQMFKINLLNCTLALYRTLYANSYSSYMISSYSGSVYYNMAGNAITTYNPTNASAAVWNYSHTPVEFLSPDPEYSNFTVDSYGRSWYVDSNARLWLGTASTGGWTGWVNLPTSIYYDFYYVKYILAVNSSTIKIVTDGGYYYGLRIYTVNVGGF